MATRSRTISAVLVVTLIAAVGATVAVRQMERRRIEAQQSRERQLTSALAAMRQGLAAYHAKNGKGPASLADLVRGGQLRAIPVDPFTGSAATWKTSVEESVDIDDFREGKPQPKFVILDVQSGANGTDSHGRRFSDY